jgi:hypothetical protein
MKAKFVSKYGTPITGAQKQMTPNTAGGAVGSMQNAEAQIKQAPQPFANPAGAIRGVESHQGFKQQQVHGRPSARGTRPGANTANAPNSAPMSDSALRQGAGYTKPVNYARYKVHSQPRVMRGAIHGSQPVVKPMDQDDFWEGAAAYRKEHGRL